MGLDISVYRTKSFDKFKEYEDLSAQIEAESERVWEEESKGKEYNAIPETTRNKISAKSKKAQIAKAKELKLKYEISEYGGYVNVLNPFMELVDEPSKQFPDHNFNLGYIRSSYNPSGINHILQDHLGYDLYEIFKSNDEDSYYFVPDWQEAKNLTLKAIESMEKSIEGYGALRVMEVRYNEFFGDPEKMEVKDASKAMEVYKQEVDRHGKNNSGFDNYSNGHGEFNMAEPLKVKAIINGASRMLLKEQYLPAFYIVYESDDLKWYIEGLKVIVEMCDNALNDTEHEYFLSWSS